jgi:hypothetical protein
VVRESGSLERAERPEFRRLVVWVTNGQADGFVVVMRDWTRCSDAELLAATRFEPDASRVSTTATKPRSLAISCAERETLS